MWSATKIFILFYFACLLAYFTVLQTLHPWLLQSQEEVVFHFLQKEQQKTKQNKRETKSEYLSEKLLPVAFLLDIQSSVCPGDDPRRVADIKLYLGSPPQNSFILHPSQHHCYLN